MRRPVCPSLLSARESHGRGKRIEDTAANSVVPLPCHEWSTGSAKVACEAGRA